MNHRIIFIISTLLTTFLYAQQSESALRARHLTDRIFGHAGAQIPYVDQEIITALLQKLLTASEYQRLSAAQKTVLLLQNKREAKEKQLQEEPRNKQVVTNLFIVQVQKNHLEQYYQETAKTMGWFDYALYKIKILFNWEKEETTILTQLLYDYCNIQQEYIFSHYSKMATFFAVQDRYKLPQLIDFFDHPLLQKASAELVKQSECFMVIQVEEVLPELMDAGEKEAEEAEAEILDKEGSNLTVTQEAGFLTKIKTILKNLFEKISSKFIRSESAKVTEDEFGDAGSAKEELIDSIPAEPDGGDIASDDNNVEGAVIQNSTAGEGSVGENALSGSDGEPGDDTVEGGGASNVSGGDSVPDEPRPITIGQSGDDAVGDDAVGDDAVGGDNSKKISDYTEDQQAAIRKYKRMKQGVEEQEKQVEEAQKNFDSAKKGKAKIAAEKNLKAAQNALEKASKNLDSAAQELEETGVSTQQADEVNLRSADRYQNYLDQIRETRAARDTQEAEELKTAGKLKVGWIKFKQFFRKAGITENGFYDRVDAGYKAYVYDTIIRPLEDNALKRGLDSLPGWLRTPADLMIQMSIMSGGGMVTTWISQDDEQVYQQYATQQTAMAAIVTRLNAQLNAQVAKKMNVMQIALNKNLAALSQMSSNQYSNIEQRNLYLDQAIAVVPPVQNFTVDGSDGQTVMEIDQMFVQSALFTPDSVSADLQKLLPGAGAWHNVFQSGNWLYYYPINGFYQTQLVELSQATALENGAQVLYNTIFREYIPTEAQSYTIQVQCTLINYAQEFFLGVVFNNARWISGVPDRYHQHRFAGIFGTGGKMYLVCEESINNPKGTKPNTAWPAYQILTDPDQYTVSKNRVTFKQLPATFTLTITAYPTAATVSITDGKNRQIVPPLQQNNFQPSVFNYHGIGLTSAGCIAQFKIIEPEALTYTAEQVKNFATLATQSQEVTS